MRILPYAILMAACVPSAYHPVKMERLLSPDNRLSMVCICCAAAVLASVLAWRLHLNLASASIVEMLVIVFLSNWAGLLPATLASLCATAALNFLFIAPVYSFAVADTQNWVSLAAFEACAVVVSRISTRARLHAKLAEEERNVTQRLFEASRSMLWIDYARPPGPQILDALRRVFPGLKVALYYDDPQQSWVLGPPDMEERLRATYFNNSDSQDERNQLWLRVLRVGTRPKGALALWGLAIPGHVADALASMASVALETARSLESESRAIAGRDTEKLRAAVLDALAHDFKSPLTSILTASGGLLEDPCLSPSQAEFAQLIESEAASLSSLATRLLRTARLDSGNLKIQREPVPVGDLIRRMTQTIRPRLDGRILRVDVADDVGSADGDREKLELALVQILDNAVKYSTPGSDLSVRAWQGENDVSIAIENMGATIPKQDRARIFDRFYRVPGTEHLAGGSGLGLSVTKKIIEAHQGKVWAGGDAERTVFTVVLPTTRGNN